MRTRVNKLRNDKGQLHSEVAPAYSIWKSSRHHTDVWYYNGKIHRSGDLPAITMVDWDGRKIQEWYSHGRRHRIDKPAVISYGVKEWWYRGQRHRIGKPAYINKITTREKWYVNGKLHRDGDLPAVYRKDSDRTSLWYQHGNLHRLNGPAEIGHGYKIWYQNGIKHRVDGPAIEYTFSKIKKWIINGNEIPIDEIIEWRKQLGNPRIPFNKNIQFQFVLRFSEYATESNI